jgi:adenosine deaminase CECR1
MANLPANASIAEKIDFANSTFQKGVQDQSQNLKYTKQHLQLVEKEQKDAWWYKAKQKATDTEYQADLIVFKIREHERENLFGSKASEAIPGPETRDMGGQFLTNRDRIEESKVYEIAKAMPKGGHLHLHFNAELSPEILIERARDRETMFIRSTQPLISDEAFDEAELVFDVLPLDTPQADLFSAAYNPEFRAPGCRPWMQWIRFREEFRIRRSDKDNINSDPEKWIKTKMVLGADVVYDQTQTVNG